MINIMDRMRRLEAEMVATDKMVEVRDQGIAVLEDAVETLQKAMITKDVFVEAIETRDRDQGHFGYFCAYKYEFSTAFSVMTYDRLLYSNQFGLQGESPGVDLTNGKFSDGISGARRVDFSLITYPAPGELYFIYTYKNGEQIPETFVGSSRSSTGSGYDSFIFNSCYQSQHDSVFINFHFFFFNRK